MHECTISDGAGCGRSCRSLRARAMSGFQPSQLERRPRLRPVERLLSDLICY